MALQPRLAAVWIGGIALTLLALEASAVPKAPKDGEPRVVTRIDEASGVITVGDGASWRKDLVVEPATRILRDGRSVGLDAVRVGDRVRYEYTLFQGRPALESLTVVGGPPSRESRAESREELLEALARNTSSRGASLMAVASANKVIRRMYSRLEQESLRRLRARGLAVVIHRETFVGTTRFDRSRHAGSRGGSSIQIDVDEEDVRKVATLVHELAHAVHFVAPSEEWALHGRLLDDERGRAGKTATPRNRTMVAEYFAQSVEMYFGVGMMHADGFRRTRASGGRGPEWLRKNRPQLYEYLERAFGPPADLSGG